MRWRLPLSTMRRSEMSIGEKLQQFNIGLLLLVAAVGAVGVAWLYSAAGGNMEPWSSRHAIRLGVGFAVLAVIALVEFRVWLKYAYAIYGVTFLLLLYVEVAGEIGMGAQRWIDLKFIQLQPSEMMKIALILALARYFHRLSLEDVRSPFALVLPTAMVLVPAGLVLLQPDLGTAAILMMLGAGIFFISGVRIWKFVVIAVAGLSALPVAWSFLRDYQKNRILTFLDPSSDPLGTGYHITQSKIAFGNGGVFGRGFLDGTQAQLNFLPEHHTDFIFTMIAEEKGLVGTLTVLLLYTLILIYGYAIAYSSKNHFGRIIAIGMTLNLFLYVFVNMAMVMGLIPVVGVPLPMISYGGTAMITVMAGFGLLMSVYINRDLKIAQRGFGEE
jgi:rod shape determining protein RodA